MDTYNVWIEVDIAKIKSNIRKIKALVKADVNLMAIVKANAYGHGMVHIARTLADEVNYFGVSSYEEGNALRRDGILTPILMLGSVLPYEWDRAIDSDLTFSVSDIGYARELNTVGKKHGKKVRVHVKVDTGMGRWGIPYTHAFEDIKIINDLSFIEMEGIFTHFPVAENEHMDYTDRQIELFKALLDELNAQNIHFQYTHAANSAGIVNFSESHFSLVRPGIMIYGYYPQEYLQKKLSLERVLSLKTRVSLIKEFTSRRGIGYGRKFITKKKTKIAVIPVGYSHGYPYALSQKAYVLIKGKRYPVAGSISMDYTMIDLGDTSDVVVGDEVIMLGVSRDEEITAYELAKEANTIPYEIITSLNIQIPRIYIHDEASS
ncbi:MAG: alanine racemase [Candidatus Omnitrophica bacterium]|nr:alanine racemase [Candidatus Omnitrophota bacterium]